jgi:hypothetical protein
MYSLGVVMYEMLAGEPPFVRETPVATAMAHIHEQPRPIRELRPETPLELAHTVHDCLEKDPARRPTPEALAARLGTPELAADAVTLPVPVGEPTAELRIDESTAPVMEPPRRRGLGVLLTTPPGTIPPGRPRRDRRLRWLVGALVVVVALVVFALAAGSHRSVHVPSFLGLSKRAAATQARQAGVAISFVPSNGPAGTISRQRPRPGALVPRGSIVVLTVQPIFVSSPLPFPSTSPSPPATHGPEHGKGKGHEKHGGGD